VEKPLPSLLPLPAIFPISNDAQRQEGTMNMHPRYSPHSVWSDVCDSISAIGQHGLTTWTGRELDNIAGRLALWPDPRLRDVGRLLHAIARGLEEFEVERDEPVTVAVAVESTGVAVDWDSLPFDEPDRKQPATGEGQIDDAVR
jgi:hypothetical protein